MVFWKNVLSYVSGFFGVPLIFALLGLFNQLFFLVLVLQCEGHFSKVISVKLSEWGVVVM